MRDDLLLCLDPALAHRTTADRAQAELAAYDAITGAPHHGRRGIRPWWRLR